jgi:hypothetical protein
LNTDIDHLVVVADTLDQGAAWCEATLGTAPGPGGRHPLMGTHNRLLRIDGPDFPRAYLEIIAIDPDAPPPGRPRWFGLDDPALRAAVKVLPRLHHVVLRTPDIERLRQGLVHEGLQPGEPIAAERATPNGLLRWRILVRPDGRIAADGALPTLIEWSGPHPAEAMPASPVRLTAARLRGLAPAVQTVLRLRGGSWAAAPAGSGGGDAYPPLAPRLEVTLDTPRGPVTLRTDEAGPGLPAARLP